MKKKLHFLYVVLMAMLLIPCQSNAQFWSENFDNLTSGVPEGWVVEGSAPADYYWKVASSSYPGVDGSKCLYYNTYTSATKSKTAILKTKATLRVPTIII